MRESRVMLEAAMLKRDALDRVVSSDDRHTLIKMWQFMMDAMAASQRETRAEALEEAAKVADQYGTWVPGVTGPALDRCINVARTIRSLSKVLP